MPVRSGGMTRWWICCGLLALLAKPAVAGPPYISDDPEPTDYQHFEIYTYNLGTVARNGSNGQSGIDFNYGAAPDLQLTATLPEGFDRPIGGGTDVGWSNVQLAAKYRFLHQDGFGLDVSIFPRIFLPSGSNLVGDNHASLLLPIWIQKDWNGGWSAFGGGGCTVSELPCRRLLPSGRRRHLQLCPSFRSAPNCSTRPRFPAWTPATTSLGVGWRYDLNDNYHLLGYVSRGIENTNETNQVSWYVSVLFTF